MKKYKILLFILLMIFSTNVYAYNWCRGGRGINAYNFCDQEIYYRGSVFNCASYAPRDLGDINDGFYTLKDLLDKAKDKNASFIYQYTHYNDLRRDKAGSFFMIDTIGFCNGSCAEIGKKQYFRTNTLLDVLGANEGSDVVTNFNNNVKKNSLIYYQDYQHKIANRGYVKVDRYVLKSAQTIELINVTTDLGDITNAFGVSPGALGGESWSYHVPSSSDKPDVIYYNASSKTVSRTKGNGDIELKREDLLVPSSIQDTGSGYNWCKGGESFNSYDICGYRSNSVDDTDCPGNNPGTPMETLIGSLDFNENNFNMEVFGNLGDGSSGGVYFGDNYLLAIFGCPNGVCDNYNTSDCKRNYYYTKPYTNKYLLKKSDFALSYNSNVITESKTYRDMSKTEEIKITVITMPVLDVNGLITNNYNKALLIEINSSSKIGEISNKPGNIEFLSWLNQKYVSWPKVIFATTNDERWVIKGSQFDGSIRFYDGSTGTEQIERIPVDTSDCAGVAKVKQLIDKYFIKAMHILAPIVLLIMTTLDLVHGVFSGQKELNKAVGNFAKRALVCIIFYFSGNIISLLFDLAGIPSCGTVDTGDVIENTYVERPYIDDSDFND